MVAGTWIRASHSYTSRSVAKSGTSPAVRSASLSKNARSSGVRSSSRAFDQAPTVPRQQLYFVERRHIAHEIAAHKPQPVHVENAERFRVGLPAPTQSPRLPADDKAVARHIQRVEIYLERVTTGTGRVVRPPAPSAAAPHPILGHPMVLIVTGPEVGPEPAARPRRDALMPQNPHEQQREVAAVADQLLVQRARDGQGPVVQFAAAAPAVRSTSATGLPLCAPRLAAGHTVRPKTHAPVTPAPTDKARPRSVGKSSSNVA